MWPQILTLDFFLVLLSLTVDFVKKWYKHCVPGSNTPGRGHNSLKKKCPPWRELAGTEGGKSEGERKWENSGRTAREREKVREREK